MQVILKSEVHPLLKLPDTPRRFRELAESWVTQSTPGILKDLVILAQRESVFNASGPLTRLVKEWEHRMDDDPNFWVAISYLAWVASDHSASRHWAKRVILQRPEHFMGYLRLGMAFLTEGEPLDAFLTFSAGAKNSREPQSLGPWWALSEHLSFHGDSASFSKNGRTYRFHLSATNGQMAEAACTHLMGTFTEQEELDFLGKQLPPGGHLVEVGTLVGNHSVFLASTLRPEKLFCMDLAPEAVAMTSKNLEGNQLHYPDTRWEVLQAALVADEATEARFHDASVPTRRIEDLLTPKVTFAKIDVDGMERQIARPLCKALLSCRCAVMIEVEKPFIPEFQHLIHQVGYRISRSFDHGSYQNLFIQTE